MSKRFRLILSAAFGVLALMACLGYGEQVRAEAETDRAEALERYGGELVGIVVAARDLEPGEKVDSLTCEERDWVAELVPEGSLTSLEDSLGLTLTSPVSAGTPITETAVREDSTTLPIPDGTVAMSVALGDKTGVGSDVALGTQLVGYRVVDGETRVVSTGLTVIGQGEGASASGASLTVAVPLDDVAAFIAAATDGSLRLVQPADGLYGVESGTAEGEADAGQAVDPVAPPNVPAEGDDAEIGEVFVEDAWGDATTGTPSEDIPSDAIPEEQP